MTPPCDETRKNFARNSWRKRKRDCSDAIDSNEPMKNLADWLWKTRCHRSDERKWAHVAEIPMHFRPTIGQILQPDWQQKSLPWMGTYVRAGELWMDVQTNEQKRNSRIQDETQERRLHGRKKR